MSIACPSCPPGTMLVRREGADACAGCATVLAEPPPDAWRGTPSLELAFGSLGREVRVKRDPDGVRLAVSWRHSAGMVWLLGAITLVALVTSIAFALSDQPDAGLVALGSGLAACAAGYLTLVVATNRVGLRVTDDALVLEHGPLWWGGGQRLARADLASLRVVLVIPRFRSGGEAIVPDFEVRARLRDGREEELITTEAPWAARLIERDLTRRLGLAPLAPPLRAAA